MTQRYGDLIFIAMLVGSAVSGCGVEFSDEGAGSALNNNGSTSQFAGGFNPSSARLGGFGGGDCTATKTPVVFVHGNGVDARFFDLPASDGGPSVHDTLKAAGYNDCELFGVTWLSASEQLLFQANYHTSTKAGRIRDFINEVKSYTGQRQVNIIAHSMGVTVAQHGITFGGLWDSVASFINVAGSPKGLSSCIAVGFANPLFPSCGSQNLFNSNTFGLWPHGVAGASNPRMGSSASVGFRREPSRHPEVRFFTISGGSADIIVGGNQVRYDVSPAVKAQLDVGLGHIGSFTDTGAIVNTMLTTACTGTECCSDYSGPCGNL